MKTTGKERPILFSAPMVRAILAGQKTQTRRLFMPGVDTDGALRIANTDRWQPMLVGQMLKPIHCPYGVPGDRLWVRETWGDADHFYQDHENEEPSVIAYRADRSARYADGSPVPGFDIDTWNWDTQKWRPSIFMRRWASRLSLKVTGVRVERLQELTEEDARAEGVQAVPFCRAGRPNGMEHVDAFEDLWNQINSKRAAWSSNPWVWVVEFKRIEASQ